MSTSIQKSATLQHSSTETPPLTPTVEVHYCLPADLLDCLEEELPGWLTADKLEFEQELRSRCEEHLTIGLFWGRPFQDMTLTRPCPPAFTKQFLKELGWDKLVNLARIRAIIRSAFERSAPLLEQLEAYRGWLITNTMYLTEIRHLRKRWNHVIQELRYIPPYPVRVHKGSVRRCPRKARDVTNEFVNDFNSFYERWELRGLATWDLPQPQGANLSGIPWPASVRLPSSTVGMHFSSILSIPGHYPLRGIVDEIQRYRTPNHLNGWREVQHQQHAGDLRFTRFRRMFLLHFWRDVVLASRYRDRMDGHVDGIDRAFGAFFGGLSEDSIKRLRLQMYRLRFA